MAVDYAVKVNGLDGIALSKLDVLDGFDEIKICTAYEIDGKIRGTSRSCAELEKAKPVYETLPGWKAIFRAAARFGGAAQGRRIMCVSLRSA